MTDDNNKVKGELYYTIYCEDCNEYSHFQSQESSLEFMTAHKHYNVNGDHIQPMEEMLNIEVIEVLA